MSKKHQLDAKRVASQIEEVGMDLLHAGFDLACFPDDPHLRRVITLKLKKYQRMFFHMHQQTLFHGWRK